jgi:hypothetical protein
MLQMTKIFTSFLTVQMESMYKNLWYSQIKNGFHFSVRCKTKQQKSCVGQR